MLNGYIALSECNLLISIHGMMQETLTWMFVTNMHLAQQFWYQNLRSRTTLPLGTLEYRLFHTCNNDAKFFRVDFKAKQNKRFLNM
jgi:hypothetical protein